MAERVTRPVTVEDFEPSVTLGLEAFGTPPAGTSVPTAAEFPYPGRHSFGTFEDDRLLARLIGREYHSWFRGVEVPTCGIAGVTVAAEHRGEGLLGALFGAVLTDARSRGEVVSTLYPTAPGIYRPFGYEVVGSYDTVEVPTTGLARVRPPVGVTARRATLDDLPAVREVYDAWAAQQNGPLTRRGPSFPTTDEELLAGFTGITVAVDADGAVVGYASWDRGQGYGAAARLEVLDLIGLTPDACRALWRVLGSFATVVPAARVRTSGADLARLVLPFLAWTVVETHPYMLRVDDVRGAFEALPLVGAAVVPLRVVGDRLGVLDGDYLLEVGPDGVRCTPSAADPAATVLTPHGLALLWSGAQSCGNLRLAGHLTDGSPADDAALDALLGGRQLHVRDYF